MATSTASVAVPPRSESIPPGARSRAHTVGAFSHASYTAGLSFRISAAIDTAICAGVRAPIGSPTGQ